MAKHRSPNYPAHSLSEAVELVRRVYKKESRSQSSGEIVAKALGYTSMSGNARVKIATLKKFGLLDGDEAKGLRVSDLAMAMLFPSSPLEEGDARKRAALKPVLFQMLYEDKLQASDDAIINHLISKMDFAPIGAKQALDAFRDTMIFAGLTQSGYAGFDDGDKMEAWSVQTETRPASVPAAVPESSFGKMGTTARMMKSWTWTLSMPRNVDAELKIAGDVTKADIVRLKKQIEALEESFDEDENIKPVATS